MLFPCAFPNTFFTISKHIGNDTTTNQLHQCSGTLIVNLPITLPNMNLLHGHGGHKPLECGNAGEEETEAPHADVAEDDAPEVQPGDVG